MRESLMPRRKQSKKMAPTPQRMVVSLDLMPLDRARELAVTNILRAAQIRPKGTIFLLDPLEQVFGPSLQATDINRHQDPGLYVRVAIERFGCNWSFWQNWGEA